MSIILAFKQWTNVVKLRVFIFLSNFIILLGLIILWLSPIIFYFGLSVNLNILCLNKPLGVVILSLTITSIILFRIMLYKWLYMLRQKAILDSLCKHPLSCATFFNHFFIRMEMIFTSQKSDEHRKLFLIWINSFGNKLREKIGVNFIGVNCQSKSSKENLNQIEKDNIIKQNLCKKHVQFNKSIFIINSTHKLGKRLVKINKNSKYLLENHHYSTIDSAGELADIIDSPKIIIQRKPKVPRTPIPQTTPTDPQGPLLLRPILLSPIDILSNQNQEKEKKKKQLILTNKKCNICPLGGVSCCIQNIQASIHYYNLSKDVNSNKQIIEELYETK